MKRRKFFPFAFRIWFVLFIAFEISMKAENLTKAGAGLLITSGDQLLLLLRSSHSGHPNTWGLPGGNMEENETPIATALRESVEELGKPIPNYTVRSEIPTLRGKKMDKAFTVFVVRISPEDKESFKPELNNEHVDYKWFAMGDISGIPNLHPIVKTVFRDHTQELANALEV